MHQSMLPQAIIATLSFLRFTQAVDTTQWSTAVEFQLQPNAVTVDGHLSYTDIFNSVWARRTEFGFDGAPAQIGSTGCTIKYTGHGDASWTTTNGMAQSLMTVVAPADGVVKYSSYTKTECLEWDFPEDPRQKAHCAQWGPVTYQQTSIVSMLEVDVINNAPAGSGIPPSDQGQMNYAISCPAGANLACDACLVAKTSLSTLALLPEIGVAFGLTNVAVSATCHAADC